MTSRVSRHPVRHMTSFSPIPQKRTKSLQLTIALFYFQLASTTKHNCMVTRLKNFVCRTGHSLMESHSEQRPQNIYSLEEINLYFIIKLATHISLFSLQISKNLMFCVDEIKYEHLAILSNIKSCQFALGIVIFNVCICCQFEDLQIISPRIIPMSYQNIWLWQMRAHFFPEFFSLSYDTYM